jgi:hypothetical protein
MTKREIAYQIEQEGIDPMEVSLSAVSAYRVEYFEKSGRPMGFMQAVVEMYSKDEMDGDWMRLDGEIECRT